MHPPSSMAKCLKQPLPTAHMMAETHPSPSNSPLFYDPFSKPLCSFSPRPPSLTALLHSRSVYAIVPELAAHLPPEAPPQAHPYTPLGLHGQQARATVYIEEVILPQAEQGLHERPMTALYHVSYRCLATVSESAWPARLQKTNVSLAGGLSMSFCDASLRHLVSPASACRLPLWASWQGFCSNLIHCLLARCHSLCRGDAFMVWFDVLWCILMSDAVTQCSLVIPDIVDCYLV